MSEPAEKCNYTLLPHSNDHFFLYMNKVESCHETETASKNSFKIGYTGNPTARIGNYFSHGNPIVQKEPKFIRVFRLRVKTRKEAERCERTIHNLLRKFRVRWDNHGSEFFYFADMNDCTEFVTSLITSQPWFDCIVSMDDLRPAPRKAISGRSTVLSTEYAMNTNFELDIDRKNEKLSKMQAPIIAAITQFIEDPERLAGFVIAPCGSGKTKMTCESIRLSRCTKVVVDCPSLQIMRQWCNELKASSVFETTNIHLVCGEQGTANESVIQEIMNHDIYCIIVSGMSSRKLVAFAHPDRMQLVVYDEAHHQAGVVAVDDTGGEGITRRLLNKCVDMQVKRLFLTFTPRFIDAVSIHSKQEVYCMRRSVEVFGEQIATLNYREMIDQGIMPDFRVWELSDEARKGRGNEAKAEFIMEALHATEEVFRDTHGNLHPTYILNHLLVYTRTKEEGRYYYNYLKSHLVDDNIEIVCVDEDSHDVEECIGMFSGARRSVMISCRKLNEGVDIPIADSVMITFPKFSHGDISQMVLRAGRWHPNKEVFHILFPVLEDSDNEGFAEVICALSLHDVTICDEINHRLDSRSGREGGGEGGGEGGANENEKRRSCRRRQIENESSERIMLQEICEERKLHNLKERIRGWHQQPRQKVESYRKYCVEKEIDSSYAYKKFREGNPDEGLPEKPDDMGAQDWYSYLHPENTRRVTTEAFVALTQSMFPSRPRPTHEEYDVWRTENLEERRQYPSAQHIIDGYFGESQWNDLPWKEEKKSGRR